MCLVFCCGHMIVVFFFSVFVNVTECFHIIVCVLSDRGDNNSAAGRKSRSGAAGCRAGQSSLGGLNV